MEVHDNLWKQILESAIVAIIYTVPSCFTFYQAFVYMIDKKVKSDTDFIDSRVLLKLREENKDLEIKNKELENRIKDIEHKFYEYNEQRIREITDLLKGYK